MRETSHYEILSVAPNAPAEVIRAAYRALSQTHHPDRNNGDPSSTARMTLINEAYRVLSDATLRQQHDEWLSTSRPSTTVGASPQPTPATSSSAQRTAHRVPPSDRNDLDGMYERFKQRIPVGVITLAVLIGLAHWLLA